MPSMKRLPRLANVPEKGRTTPTFIFFPFALPVVWLVDELVPAALLLGLLLLLLELLEFPFPPPEQPARATTLPPAVVARNARLETFDLFCSVPECL